MRKVTTFKNREFYWRGNSLVTNFKEHGNANKLSRNWNEVLRKKGLLEKFHFVKPKKFKQIQIKSLTDVSELQILSWLNSARFPHSTPCLSTFPLPLEQDVHFLSRALKLFQNPFKFSIENFEIYEEHPNKDSAKQAALLLNGIVKRFTKTYQNEPLFFTFHHKILVHEKDRLNFILLMQILKQELQRLLGKSCDYSIWLANNISTHKLQTPYPDTSDPFLYTFNLVTNPSIYRLQQFQNDKIASHMKNQPSNKIDPSAITKQFSGITPYQLPIADKSYETGITLIKGKNSQLGENQFNTLKAALKTLGISTKWISKKDTLNWEIKIFPSKGKTIQSIYKTLFGHLNTSPIDNQPKKPKETIEYKCPEQWGKIVGKLKSHLAIEDPFINAKGLWCLQFKHSSQVREGFLFLEEFINQVCPDIKKALKIKTSFSDKSIQFIPLILNNYASTLKNLFMNIHLKTNTTFFWSFSPYQFELEQNVYDNQKAQQKLLSFEHYQNTVYRTGSSSIPQPPNPYRVKLT